jgi:hypothetical protein
MDASYLQNIVRLRAVAQALKPLDQKVVFVGGATIALYANPETAMEVRPTDDIDVVVELATYGALLTSFTLKSPPMKSEVFPDRLINFLETLTFLVTYGKWH